MTLKTVATSLQSDPLSVFERLAADHDYCFLLETPPGIHQPQASGRSYIGVAPVHRYAAKGDVLYTDGRPHRTADTYGTLRRQLSRRPGLPGGYNGGLVGYCSHEAMGNVEPSLHFPYSRQFPDFEFAEYNDGLLFNPGRPPEYFYYDQNRLDLYMDSGARKSRPLRITFEGAAKDHQQYGDMVESAREDIRNGRVFQAVLANRYEYGYEGDLLQLYRELRRINPSPFMFFIKCGDIVTLGASPELLLRTDPGGEVSLEALAGTIKRGKTPAEDAELAQRLRHDEKEIAEHNMLVDLYRNDLGRVAEVGSVRIDDLKYIKQLSHVQHLCSLISGRLSAGKDMFDAFKAVFPAGTLVGAPKIEAAKMIAELEGYERGPFGGSVGYFGYNGESMHAVNIRAVNAVGSRLFLHTGSGIVYDSRPDREYHEISAKKAAMDAAMAKFLGGTT